MVINPANVCERAGVDEFHVDYRHRTISVPDGASLHRIAVYLGKETISSQAYGFNSLGWFIQIGDTHFNQTATKNQ